MNVSSTPIETLFVKVQDYSNTTLELYRLKAIQKSADVASSLILRLAVFMVVALSVVIINIGIAIWIGQLLGNSSYGFFIIGGFYALIAIILHGYRHSFLKHPISHVIIAQMLKQKGS